MNIRPRENDEEIPLGRVFKKQRLLVRKKDKKTDATPNMTQCISSHNFHGSIGRNIGQKTFISTCFFQPKRVPVRYTETMIMNINSAKRRYYESVAYETKMVPAHWSQTMFVDVHPGRDRFVSEVLVPCDIYVPLIPQAGVTQTITETCEPPPKHTTDNQETSKIEKSCAQLTGKPRNATEEFLNEMRRMY